MVRRGARATFALRRDTDVRRMPLRRERSRIRIARTRTAIVILLALTAASARGYALEASIMEIRIAGGAVHAAIDLRGTLPEKLRQVLQAGGALHVRLQAELWEDRPLWDRLVRPAAVTVYRIVQDPSTSHIAISDALGRITSHPTMPSPLQLRADVVPADAVSDDNRYYLRMIATIGTIAQRDVESTGEAVFGKDEGIVSVGKVGKFIFHAVLQATDYLQSVSAEARSRRFAGRELRPGLK
jgi:hypothetical protein